MTSSDPLFPEYDADELIITLPGWGMSSYLPYEDFHRRLNFLPPCYATAMLGLFPFPPQEGTGRDLQDVLHATPKGKILIDQWVSSNKGRLEFLSHRLAEGPTGTGHEEEKEGAIQRRRDLLAKAAAAATFGLLASGTREAVMDPGPKKDIVRIATLAPAGIYGASWYVESIVEDRFLKAVQALNDRIEESYVQQYHKALTPVTIAPGLPSKASVR